MRRLHFWTAPVFIGIVAAIFAGQALGSLPEWVYFLPLPPLFLMMISGAVMWVKVVRARGG